MLIEDEIFKKSKVDINKLLKYGFIEDNSIYKYTKYIMNNTFKVDIMINKDGIVKGKIYDNRLKDEYINFRIKDINGSFSSEVRDEFKNILLDIKNKCFINKLFIYEQTNRIANKIKLKYNDNANFEWEKYPGYAVFKNSITKKWYAIIMNIDKSKIDSNYKGEIEIINVKLNPSEIQELLKQNGYYQAYHMNKKNWITIILDDTIKDEDIMNLIIESYSYTIKKNQI